MTEPTWKDCVDASVEADHSTDVVSERAAAPSDSRGLTFAPAESTPVAIISPILEHLDRLEVALAEAGFPAMSPWWYRTVVDFYGRAARQLVLRVGRRGGKSSTLCRIAVLESLFGDHVIPPGDVGVVAIVSVSMREATERLRTIRAILDAFDIGYDRKVTSEIRLTSRPVVFRIFAATQGAVSGFTAICIICDEVSKWMNEDTGANPAAEVLAAIRPTMATMPHARIFLSSSPLGMTDAHAEAFALGGTEYQSVAHAETWVAHPAVTEEETHRLEPDVRIWKREYAAIPQHAVLGAFDPEDIARAFQPREPGIPGHAVMINDVSSGKKDSWTWGVCRFETPVSGDPPYIRFMSLDGIHGAFWKTEKGPEVVGRIASIARDSDALTVHGDQREEFMVTGEFGRCGLGYFPHAWTATSKPEAIQVVRRWLREGLLSLPPHEPMRKELLAFEERVTPSGGITFGARGGAHDDYVALLVTAAMAHEERFFYAVALPADVVVETEAEREKRRREDRRRQWQQDQGQSKVRSAMARSSRSGPQR